METSTCSKERRYPGFLSSQMCFSHISALEKFSIIKSSVTPLIHLSSSWCLLFHVKLLRWLSWQSRAVAPSCYWRANNPFVYSTKLLKYYSKTQTYLFFVQSFCLCLLLWLVEVVQRWVVDGQSHWLLTLDVNDLNHWSLLLIVFQMEPGEMKVWNSVKKKATVLSITRTWHSLDPHTHQSDFLQYSLDSCFDVFSHLVCRHTRVADSCHATGQKGHVKQGWVHAHACKCTILNIIVYQSCRDRLHRKRRSIWIYSELL